MYGGKLLSVDTAPAEAMPGVKRVVQLDEAVAVVADSYWRARTALAALKPKFDDAGHGEVSSDTIFAAFDKALGAPPEMPKDAAKVVTADYRVPFLAHATMEPMVCTASVTGDRAEVWAGVAGSAERALHRGQGARHRRRSKCRSPTWPLGGGFGRRLPYNLDYVGLGARIAKAMSPAPVKTIWSRENDIQHDYYRPAGMSRFAGALDAAGTPLAVTLVTTRAAATANRCSCRTRLPRRRPRRATRSIPSGRARGGRCSTRSTASSRSRSSTSWRMRRARIRSSSAATC